MDEIKSRTAKIIKTMIRISGKSQIEVAEFLSREKATPENRKKLLANMHRIIEGDISVSKFFDIANMCKVRIFVTIKDEYIILDIESVLSGEIFRELEIRNVSSFPEFVFQLQQKNISLDLQIEDYRISFFDENAFREIYEKRRKRNEDIHIRCSTEEKKKIIENAEKANKKLSDYIISAATEDKVIIYDMEPVIRMNTEINKIGTNINQIAHMVNIYDSVKVSELKIVKAHLEELQREYAQFLKKVVNKKLE